MIDGANESNRSKVRDILGAFLFRGDAVEKYVSVLSGGERNRLALAKLLLQPLNVLVMDEPTNHLDAETVDWLQKYLIEYKGTDEDSLDVTILSILNDRMVVTQSDGSDSTYVYGQNESGQVLSIYDVFSQDNISVTGDAKLTGRSKLEPGRSVWANMEVMIDPLSIIITDNMSFISEVPITLEPIDASTSSKIDSGIVSATVDLEIENAIPLNGTIDMIISNSQFFPPCLDTLIAGSMTDQLPLISNACAQYLYSKHSPSNGETSGPGQITVQSKGDYNFYYIEFINPSSSDTTFFGKFLNMSLILPDEINDDGIVITPSNHTEILDLLSDEVKWLTNDNTLYIAPQVVLLSYDENDPEDNGSVSYTHLTLPTSDLV